LVHLKDMAASNASSSPTVLSLDPTNDQAAGSSLLNNPILNSLLTNHSLLALTHGRARRFPPEIGPLSGVPDQSAEGYSDLRAVAGPGGVVALFLEEPPAPPAGWTLLRGGLIDQMVCTEPARREHRLLPLEATMRPLTAGDAHAMMELAQLTEPGPFQLRTIELSAVCTHPDVRGRGYAQALMSTVMDHIYAQGKTPILHSFASNASAITVYRRLGFTRRRSFELAILQNDL
jgi:ribosomal protein S18 acetylase RimI-like enzyme